MGKQKQAKAEEGHSELLSELALEFEGVRARGDMVALAERARATLEGPKPSEADVALARRTLQSLRLDPVALGFFVAALCIWAVAFTLGIVLRHG